MKNKVVYILFVMLLLATFVSALSSCTKNNEPDIHKENTDKAEEKTNATIDPNLLIDICMENIDMWTEDEDTYYSYDDSLFYSFLDLDFDGTPEFIVSANQYELRDPENRYFKINTEDRYLEEILPKESYPCDIGDPDQGKTKLLKNKKTGELCYWCEDFYAYMTGGTGSKFKTMYYDGYVLHEQKLFEEYTDYVSMHSSKSKYTVFPEDGTATEVDKSEYDKQKQEFLDTHEDLNLKFESAVGPAFWKLSKPEQKQALLDALLSYSYNGFSIPVPDNTDYEENNDNSEESLDSYKWIIEPSANFGNISVVRDVVGGSVAIGVAVSEKDGTFSLIGYDGQIKKADYNRDYTFCLVSRAFTNYDYVIDSADYSMFKFTSGYGIHAYSPYIYDLNDGQVYDVFGAKYQPNPQGDADIIVEGIKNVNEYGYGDYETKDKYGVYYNYELVVPYEYDSWLSRDEQYSIFALGKNGKWTYFDRKGNIIVSDVSAVSDDSDSTPYSASFGHICIRKNGKWGYVDIKGNTVIEPIFEDALPVYCGMAWVKTEKGWGVIKLTEFDMMSQETAETLVCEHIRDGFADIRKLDCKYMGNYYSGYGYIFKVTITTQNGEELIYRYIVDEYGKVNIAGYYN